ncbi:MAG: Hpt domain-containing protein [Planctomycetota bacterium]
MTSDSQHQHQTQRPLLSTFADDPDMQELIDLFVSDLADRIDTIAQSARIADYEKLRTVAHQLKGAAAGYGYEPIGDAARELELTLKLGTPPFDEQTIQQQTDELLNICRRALPPAV